MAGDKVARLVNRRTGSVVVVPQDKADALAVQYGTLGLEPEGEKKAPAKKAAAKKSTK